MNHRNSLAKSTATGKAGIWFARRICASLACTTPIAIIRIPPVALTSLIISGVITFCIQEASKVIEPWYKPTGNAERATPAPMFAANIIERIQSRVAYAKRIW